MRHLSITWPIDHGARVSGRLLRYPVTTVHLSGSLKALPVYQCRGWRLGPSRLLSLVLVGALHPFNTCDTPSTCCIHPSCWSQVPEMCELD